MGCRQATYVIFLLMLAFQAVKKLVCVSSVSSSRERNFGGVGGYLMMMMKERERERERERQYRCWPELGVGITQKRKEVHWEWGRSVRWGVTISVVSDSCTQFSSIGGGDGGVVVVVGSSKKVVVVVLADGALFLIVEVLFAIGSDLT